MTTLEKLTQEITYKPMRKSQRELMIEAKGLIYRLEMEKATLVTQNTLLKSALIRISQTPSSGTSFEGQIDTAVRIATETLNTTTPPARQGKG